MNTKLCCSLLGLVWAVTMIFGSSAVYGADAEGAADHELVKRIEGSEIIWSEVLDYDEMSIPLDRVEWDYSAEKFKETKKERVEGKHTILYYKLPEGVSDLEAIKQYQTGLLEAGYTILFSGVNDELDDGFNRFVEQIFPAAMKEGQLQYLHQFNHDHHRYAALKGAGKSGEDIYVSLYAMRITDNSGTGFEKIQEAHKLEKGSVVIRVDVLETKAMAERMTLVKAEEIESTISTTGRIAIYGVFFDTDKAEIKSESAPALVEMAKAIKDAGSQKFLIVGHTDNQGNYAHNQTLSSRRATAVVAELVGVYDIPADRLIPVGVGMAAPVAPNSDEEGRAKNRRVEIVAM